jgi:hypothetical protein
MHASPDFFAVDQHVPWRAQAKCHSVAIHGNYDHCDFVVDDDSLICLAT